MTGTKPLESRSDLPLWARRGLPSWTLLITMPICCSLLIAPLADPVPGSTSLSGWLAVTIGAGLFTAVIVTRYRGGAGSDRAAHTLLAGLALLAIGTTVGWSPAWSSLFVLLVIGIGIVVVNRTSPTVIFTVATAAVAVDLLAGAEPASALLNGLSVLLSGLGTYAIHQLFATVAELRCTREELARMAVDQERDRFARDLHDLLGHTLSVIVVKAEAVRRLAARDSAAAAAHAADIESIGREALTDIRRAASGYRGAGLQRELIRARGALEAAGVTLNVAPTPLAGSSLPEETDVLLGWVVREAITNVLRHSRATHCTIGVHRTGRSTQLTIEDDGSTGGLAPERQPQPESRRQPEPEPGARTAVGTGLLGLTDRVTAAGGTVNAIPTDHGFRITVDVPTNEPTGPEPTTPKPSTPAGLPASPCLTISTGSATPSEARPQ